jgi:hypothetical protein
MSAKRPSDNVDALESICTNDKEVKRWNMSPIRRFAFVPLALLAIFALLIPATGAGSPKTTLPRVAEPLDIAILVQDDLVSHVNNEISVCKDFIRSLPDGSRVMVGYITAGSLQVRQPLTPDLDKAADALRIVASSSSASPYNPYVEVLEALKKFNSSEGHRKAILLISDGLDTSRGTHPSDILNSVDLKHTIKDANKRGVVIYSFFAPSVELAHDHGFAASYGQSSLKRVSDETGGEAFFEGSRDFVTFDAYFQQLVAALNKPSRR